MELLDLLGKMMRSRPEDPPKDIKENFLAWRVIGIPKRGADDAGPETYR